MSSTPCSVTSGQGPSKDCSFIQAYKRSLDEVWAQQDWTNVNLLAERLRQCWKEKRRVFFCGNGGSAANALHAANDLIYGIDKPAGLGISAIALTANVAVLTCLANDTSYEDIFARQLAVQARAGDLLIAFSGSGNSPNIVRVLEKARELQVTSFAVLGYSGGRSLGLADHPIHFAVNDMQVSEDLQMMVVHMIMQRLFTEGRP